MIKKFFSLSISLLLIIVSVTNCYCDWITTQNDYKFFSKKHNKNYQYLWKGQHFGEVINGKGILQTYNKDELVSEQEIDAYYGSVDSNTIFTNPSNKNKTIGNFVNGKIDGFAVQVNNNESDIYIGNFLNGLPEGHLIKYKNYEMYYDGMWHNGQFNGYGTLYTKNGVIKCIFENNKIVKYSSDTIRKDFDGEYVGEILDGNANGKGVKKYYDGCKYEGFWKDNKYDGEGILTFPDNTIELGTWKEGKLDGFGIYSNNNNNIYYNGNWKEGTFDGTGYLIFDSSNTYSGEWKDDKRNGYGDAVFYNGDCYFGIWENDKKCGYGKYLWKNGNAYEGEWKDDFQNGYGVYTTKEYKYSGQWEQGWINGSGKAEYYNSDGSIKGWYIGDFVENKKFGQGEYHYSDGNIYEGEFVNDTFNGYGIFYFKNGNRYEGEFKNGQIKGEGSLYLLNGDEKVIITAIFDGTGKLPSFVNVLFENGDIYEGELCDGKLSNGKWSTLEEREAVDNQKNNEILSENNNQDNQKQGSLDKANNFYKKHKKAWGIFVIAASLALTAACFTPLAPMAAPALIALNVVDAGVTIGSAAIDKDWTGVGTEVGVNGVFLVIPKFLKNNETKKLVSKTLSPLARAIVSSGKKIISKGVKKTTNKVVYIINKNGFIKETTEKIYVRYKRFFITKECQYVTSKQVNKAIKKGAEFTKAAEKDAGILYENMKRAGMKETKLPEWVNNIYGKWQTHHIVAGVDEAAKQSRAILEKFGIDINSPMNGILLPSNSNSIFKGFVHKGKHYGNYHEYIYDKLKVAKNKSQAEFILDEIKKDLYNGYLGKIKGEYIGLYKQQKQIVNTAFSSFIRK